MTLPSPACDPSDLALIKRAALSCGALLRDKFGAKVKTWAKPGGSPVTEIDIALDTMLKRDLLAARPDYGWLSEETEDDPARLKHQRAFVVDPLDGTSAFLSGKAEFCVAIAIVEDGRAIAGVVYNPIGEDMFEAASGAGAHRNGAPMQASPRRVVEDASILTSKAFFASPRWTTPWPKAKSVQKAALALRLALVAAGEYDAIISLGFKHEWDIAAGAILIAEAGGTITGSAGEALRFNQPDPRNPGVVGGGAALHPLLIEHLRMNARPREQDLRA